MSFPAIDIISREFAIRFECTVHYVPSVHMDVETRRPSANGCLPPWRPGSIRGYVTLPISHWHSLVQITFDIFKFNHQISKNYFLVMKNLFQIFFCAYFWKVISSKRFMNMTRLLSSSSRIHGPDRLVHGSLLTFRSEFSQNVIHPWRSFLSKTGLQLWFDIISEKWFFPR